MSSVNCRKPTQERRPVESLACKVPSSLSTCCIIAAGELFVKYSQKRVLCSAWDAEMPGTPSRRVYGATTRMKPQRQRNRKVIKPQTITRAVTHIRLIEANAGKLAGLDELAPVYLALCQQYLTLFCTEEQPDKFRDPCFQTPLSERWHRVVIQQAAGITQSWRTNREEAYQGYLEEVEDYQEQQAEGTLDPQAKEPIWKEWDVPALQETCIQANANVVKLESSEDSCFDYWLKISTLDKGHPILVPVKLADYHRQALEGKTINSSVQLNRRPDGSW